MFTARAPTNSAAAFTTRMFAPAVGLEEDRACGSAHALLTPHWDAKLGTKGGVIQSQQVSKRGGDLWVRVAGEVCKVAEGVAWA